MKSNSFNLIVFDLDFTLWDAGGKWCDQTSPPYRRVNDYIMDRESNKIFLYSDVRYLLDDLRNKGYIMGLASRTFEPSWAKRLLELFKIDHFFSYKEIYPSSKTEHFRQLRIKSGFDFSTMIFFDDEYRNIEDVSSLGVKSVLVKSGISLPIIEKYLFN